MGKPKKTSQPKVTQKSKSRGKDKGRTRKRKVWTTEESNQMADYVVACGGKIVPRSSFIKHMIAANNWSVTETQAGNKLDSMLTTYKDTKNWTNETGQGVKESDGQAKFQDVVLKKCPQFDILDSVLGTRASVTAPSVNESQSPHHEIEENLEEFLRGDNNFGLDTGAEEVTQNDVVIAEDTEEDEGQLNAAAKDFKKSLETCAKKGALPKNGQDRIAIAYERKADVEEKKLDLLKAEFQLKKNVEKVKLANEQKQIDYRHKLEVARLTNNKGLMDLLVEECMQMRSESPGLDGGTEIPDPANTDS